MALTPQAQFAANLQAINAIPIDGQEGPAAGPAVITREVAAMTPSQMREAMGIPVGTPATKANADKYGIGPKT